MKIDKTIEIIKAAGVVLMTTISSILISPPRINAVDQLIINYYTFFTFLIGALSVLVYANFEKIRQRVSVWIWVILTIVLVIVYEIGVYSYSIKFADEYSRVIIPDTSRVAFKPDVNVSEKELSAILLNNNGNSDEVWDRKHLIGRYYLLIAIYFGIIVSFTMMIVYISKIQIGSNESASPG